ncbi:MAG: carboxyl transferase domain-containing protein, partial [Frankia sp.]
MTIETTRTDPATAIIPEPTATREPTDARDPHLRLTKLFDPGTLRPLSPNDAVGASVAGGLVHGMTTIAFCTDGSRQGGAVGLAEADRIAGAIDMAVLEGCPVVGLWHCGGAKLSDGVEALHGFAKIFAATTAASGRIPQISLILGPAAGGAAYGPALTDVVVMAQKGKVFVTGPDIVRSVTGEEIDAEGLGGREAHGRKSGVAHVVTDSEESAYAHTRALTSLLGDRRGYDPALVGAAERDLRELLPDNPRRVYGVHPIITAVLDDVGDHSFEELQPRWAPNVVVGLGRLAGGTVGVVANNPLRRGGCLDSVSAEKASRFVRMCDALGIPLLVIVDVPGYLPGVEQEWGGVVRRGAKLLYAFSEAVVPRVT